MYEMKAKAPGLAPHTKRRSWTGRLKDRFKSSTMVNSNGHQNGMAVGHGGDELMTVAGDDWTTAWVTHPHLQEGHHAPSVPSLQGSVFVAANFVYDYRQKYAMDQNGWMASPSVGSVAVRRTTDWTTTRGLYPVRKSPVFRSVAEPIAAADPTLASAAPYSSQYEFRAADVNQNIRQNIQMRGMKQHHQHQQPHYQRSKSSGVGPLTMSPTPPLSSDDEDEANQNSCDEEEDGDSSHLETTVAVDRPGLIVSGQRICILTGQDSSVSAIHQQPKQQPAETKVSLKVEFQRNHPLRRSLSDRVRPQMASPANFHDTTRLTQKARSRGSLHDLFGVSQSHSESLRLASPAGSAQNIGALSNRRKTIVRPTEPPPPPPPPPPSSIPCGLPASQDTGHDMVEVSVPPVAPPRRVYRHCKTDSDSSTRTSTSGHSGSDSPGSVPLTPVATPTLDLSPGVISWAGRPLIGQMVSWTAWSGHQPTISQEHPTDGMESSANEDRCSASAVLLTGSIANQTARSQPAELANASGEEQKRRPVSRLWPSFSSIGRDRSATRAPNVSDHQQPLAPSPEEEHIYEEIDESHQHRNHNSNNSNSNNRGGAGGGGGGGLCRAGRGGSFAGASRQDILRYLEELRKKHPTGIISVEAEQQQREQRKRNSSPAPSSPMTPSLPQLIVANEEEEDDEMGALLLAMRHNGPNRNSNRSTQSSTSSTQSSSQESALSAPEITPISTSTNDYQKNGSGVGGGEIERNDSGVGSETSGTAQRLRRMRRLKSSQPVVQVSSTSSNDHSPGSVPWCIDCDQPIESDQEEGHDNVVCHRCARRRCERREVLAELLETEVRYGRDLRVLQEELYKPLLVAGLVPLRQLDAVFLNVSELSNQSQKFGQRLREAVEIALEQGDEDLLTVDVARLFLDKDTEEMMDAFRRYCVRSGEASLLLSTLEKERELLRIFLRASQLENPALRRMDLHAFLMVPVQRITKYPLLLGRLLRATAQQDLEMRESLREAQAKVEFYLTAINAEAKELGTVSRPWRRGYSVTNFTGASNNSTIQRPSGEELMNLRLRKMAMDCLGWSDNMAAQLVLEGYVKLTQPGELLLTTTRSRGRTLKWQNVWIGLVTLNHHHHHQEHHHQSAVVELSGDNMADTFRLTFGAKSTVQDAAVVLIKDFKNARPGPSIYREPLMLSQCTISSEADELPNFFEIHHIVTKESFICQTADASQSQQWLHKLRTLSLGLGRWKQRRNALPHVMMIN